MCARRYLPEGLVEGCVEARHAKDAVITYDDVVLPAGRLADRLRAEQYLAIPRRDLAQRPPGAACLRREIPSRADLGRLGSQGNRFGEVPAWSRICSSRSVSGVGDWRPRPLKGAERRRYAYTADVCPAVGPVDWLPGGTAAAPYRIGDTERRRSPGRSGRPPPTQPPGRADPGNRFGPSKAARIQHALAVSSMATWPPFASTTPARKRVGSGPPRRPSWPARGLFGSGGGIGSHLPPLRMNRTVPASSRG